MSVVKTKIFAEHIAELGEGPGYDPLTGNVWWFDILGQRLIEKNWDSGETHVHELGMKASALAVIDRNRQLIVSEHGLFIRERANGRLTLHHRWRRIMKSPGPTMPVCILPAHSGSAPWAKRPRRKQGRSGGTAKAM